MRSLSRTDGFMRDFADTICGLYSAECGACLVRARRGKKCRASRRQRRKRLGSGAQCTGVRGMRVDVKSGSIVKARYFVVGHMRRNSGAPQRGIRGRRSGAVSEGSPDVEAAAKRSKQRRKVLRRSRHASGCGIWELRGGALFSCWSYAAEFGGRFVLICEATASALP